MRKEKSYTRRHYQVIYQHMRMGIDCDWMIRHLVGSVEIIKAADYSYQAYGYEVNGWISEHRRKRFYEIFWRVATEKGELPF